MAYGTIKVDTITFTDAGVDKSVTISGLVQNPTFSGNITVTGTISGNTVQGQTVSGATVTGNVGSFSTITGGTVTLTSGVFGTGTAAAPSIAFTGDSNTGIYSPGADQVAISTGGSGRLFVDASGNVGINAAAPAGRLGVDGSVVIGNQLSTGTTTGTLRAVQSTSSVYLQTGLNTTSGSSADLVFSNINASNEWMRLTAGGKLGIGTSVPNHKLHIHSTGNTPAYLRSTNDGTGTGTTDGIVIGMGDATNAYLWNYENGGIVFATNATQRAVIDSSGRVGIGTTSPGYAFDVKTSAETACRLDSGSGNNAILRFAQAGVNKAFINYQNGGGLTFGPAGSEAARIDSSGRLLVGTSAARGNFFNSSSDTALQLEGTGGKARMSLVSCFDSAGASADVILAKQKSGSVGGNTIVASGDTIGTLSYQGSDGTEFVEAANIKAFVDGTPGANDMPGRLVFSTTSDGASSPTERLRIDSSGRVGIGTTSPADVLDTAAGNYRGITIKCGTTAHRPTLSFFNTTDSLAAYIQATGSSLAFGTMATDYGSHSEKVRIDSSGRLLVGTSSALATYALQVGQVQFAQTNTVPITSVYRFTNDTGGPNFYFNKSRSSSLGANTIVQNADALGALYFAGADGSSYSIGAAISANVDGTPGANDMPGRLVFSTTADGASALLPNACASPRQGA
jgi:hypothetical protein